MRRAREVRAGGRAAVSVAVRAAVRAAAVGLGLLTALSSGLAQAACVEPPADPANTYDAQHTYTKLLRNYPFIQIADAAVPADVRLTTDHTYAQYGERCLKLDVYLPAAPGADGPPPVVVFVHGGGWASGYRAEFAPLAIRLARRGYAAVTVSYRLSGEARYPAAVEDVKAAVRWLRANAGTLRIDPTRVALAGGSAGGQIASLAGVTSAPGEVRAIVNIDGLSDFTLPAARLNEDDPAKKITAAGAWFGVRVHHGRLLQVLQLLRRALYARRGSQPPI